MGTSSESIYARLVAICNDTNDAKSFSNHQLPACVDDMRPLVVEFVDPVNWSSSAGLDLSSESLAGTSTAPGGTSLRQFCQKFDSFDPEELEDSLTADIDQFNALLSQIVPCVGCRRSVEKLYVEVGLLGYPAVAPMMIADSFLTVAPELLVDPKQLYRLLILNGSKVRSLLDSLTRCRKNKRCTLHSLDSHICKTKSKWDDLWKIMSKDCREECCIVECDSLSEMLDTYLQKHRFCAECKNKVTRAYELLIGEEPQEGDKHYNPSLYKGIRHCANDGHLHVKACPHYLNALMERAEPELFGSMRERHAKTLDIAQGEVLTCLGLYMYDRLHRILSCIRSLHQTFQLLYCTAVITLHNQFQLTWENKHGLSASLEVLCAELQDSAAKSNNGGPRKKRKAAGGQNRKKNKANSASLLLDKSESSGCLENLRMDISGPCSRPETGGGVGVQRSGSIAPKSSRRATPPLTPSPPTRRRSHNPSPNPNPQSSSISSSAASSCSSSECSTPSVNAPPSLPRGVTRSLSPPKRASTPVRDAKTTLPCGRADPDASAVSMGSDLDYGYSSLELSPSGTKERLKTSCEEEEEGYESFVRSSLEAGCDENDGGVMLNNEAADSFDVDSENHRCCCEQSLYSAPGEENSGSGGKKRHHAVRSLLQMMQNDGSRASNGLKGRGKGKVQHGRCSQNSNCANSTTTNNCGGGGSTAVPVVSKGGSVCAHGEDQGGIGPEDIAWFQEHHKQVCLQRIALRERLRAQFANMQARLAADLPQPVE